MSARAESGRVLVLVERFPAVSETFVVDHVLGLAASGFDVDVGCFVLDRPALDALRGRVGDLPRVHEVDTPAAAGPVARRVAAVTELLRRAPSTLGSVRARTSAVQARPLRRLVRRLRPDLVHAHFGPTGLAAALAASPRRLPLLVDFHGFDVTSEVRTHGWSAYRACLTDATAVVHSSFVEDLVRRNLPMEVRRVALGIDLSRFSPVQREDSWPARVRLLTCGRLVFQKGHHVALDALALLLRRQPARRFELTIVGAGPDRAALEARSRLLGVEESVRLLGPRDPAGVAEAMARADVLLVPSLRRSDGWEEAFCRVAVEGMARSLLVIGTTSGGLAETIGAGGAVTSPGDALELADTLVACMRDASPRRWAERAVDRARAFSAERSRAEYAAVTRAALSGGAIAPVATASSTHAGPVLDRCRP